MSLPELANEKMYKLLRLGDDMEACHKESDMTKQLNWTMNISDERSDITTEYRKF